jgi:hypothetical protein
MATATDDLLRLYGTTEPVAEAMRLQTGSLACELVDGAVRGVTWHGREVLRGAAWLLRDRSWGTAPATVEDMELAENAQRFEARFRLRIALDGATLLAEARVAGSAHGAFEFEVTSSTDRPITSNRCGFVVLHAASLSGEQLVVTHRDGRREETAFPRQISPAQPVLDIRALDYSIDEAWLASCSLEAQLPGHDAAPFEMEDQRNWSDASFKTYVGSLLDPWPYVVEPGVVLRQRIRITIGPRGEGGRAAPKAGAALPAIGIGAPHHAEPISPPELDAVVALAPAWIVVQAELDRDGLDRHLRQAARIATVAGARIQLDAISPGGFAPGDAARAAFDACCRAGMQPAAVRLCPKSYQPSARWPDVAPLEQYAAAAHAAFPGTRIGGGVVTYFTELNRKRQAAEALDFIGHTTCPIVHAADDHAVIETLESLAHIARSVATLWPRLGYRLGPVTIGSARNPYGDGPAPNPDGRRIALSDLDPRHQAQFGAAWHAGYAAAVAPFGLEVLAMLDAYGPRGPLGRPPRPGPHPVTRVPAWHTLAWLARRRGAPLLACDGLPDGVVGLAVADEGGSAELLLANLTPRSMSIASDRRVAVVQLDASTSDATAEAGAKVDRISLTPYGVAAAWAVATKDFNQPSARGAGR